MSGFKALVVDDSAFSRSVVIKMLSAELTNWSFDQAADGEKALAACGASGPFDLITIDMHMPHMDGLTLAATLRERQVQSHLVLVTANIQEAVQKRAEHLKLRFIPKPLTQSKVATLLEGIRKR